MTEFLVFLLRYVDKLTDISSNGDKEAVAMSIIEQHIEQIRKSNSTNENQDDGGTENENRSLKTILQKHLNNLENMLLDIKIMDTQSDASGSAYIQVS